MRKRRRRYKPSKIQFMWKLLIVAHMLLVVTQVYVRFSEQPVVKRWTHLRVVEGTWSQVLRKCNIR